METNKMAESQRTWILKFFGLMVKKAGEKSYDFPLLGM
jgi:hypothetical protein